MNNEVNGLIASIHARLLNKSKEMDRPFEQVLLLYGMERFLFRLSQIEQGKGFVLKGGLLFYAWDLPLRRPTRDIDLRGYTSNSHENLIKIFNAACEYSAVDDGLIYDTGSLKAESIIEDADYQGIRLTFLARLGRSQIPIRVDIGFTDDIFPQAYELSYPTLLPGLKAPKLLGYSRESVIAEKLHAMVYLGEITSRWKDFYDLWVLSESFNFDGTVLQEAILTTFRRRAASIPDEMPLALSDDFATQRQALWDQYLTRNKLSQEPIKDFIFLIHRLRRFLLPPLKALEEQKMFEKYWRASHDWE